MRASKEEEKLREWSSQIGIGKGPNGKNAHFVTVPPENQADSLEQIFNFCFRPEVLAHPFDHTTEIFDSAMLCPRNEDVWAINEQIMERMVGEMHVIESIDQPMNDTHEDVDKYDKFRFDSNIEAIHNETPSGLPPHILKIKVKINDLFIWFIF